MFRLKLVKNIVTKVIFHITTKEDWSKQSGGNSFSAPSLKDLGFIHCALKHQIIRVANSRLRGKTNLVLLGIEEDKLKSKLVYEDLSNLNEEHPHVYGPINIDAITQVIDFPPEGDGSFSLPEELK